MDSVQRARNEVTVLTDAEVLGAERALAGGKKCLEQGCEHFARTQSDEDAFRRRCMCCAKSHGYNELFPNTTQCDGTPVSRGKRVAK